jgi:DNA primase
MILQKSIEAVREKASLIEVIGESVSLKRAGSGYTGLCPFHGEKTPSFHIKADGSFYHCFGCGESGNVITFVMKTRGLSFAEAVEDLAQRYGVTLEREQRSSSREPRQNRQVFYQINALAAEWFRNNLKSAEPAVLDYLKKRGLSADLLQTFGVGYAPRGWHGLLERLRAAKIDEATMLQSGLIKRGTKGDIYDVFRGRLIFPVWIDARRIAAFGGRVIPALYSQEELDTQAKYLNSPETPVYQKSRVFYALPQAFPAIRETGEVYIVEGYMDVAGLWKSGVCNAIATCGTALTEHHARYLGRLARKVCVMFDGDQAGRNAAARSFSVFLNSGIDASAIFLPSEDDPDSFAARHGSETAAKLAAMDRTSLLDCAILGMVARLGAASFVELGAAAKGRVGQELSELLAKVKNGLEREDLTRQASRRLGVEMDTLRALLAGHGPALEDPRDYKGEEKVEPGSIRKDVSDLSAADRELLLCVMARKESLSSKLLNDGELCLEIDSATLGFIMAFDEILRELSGREEQRKDAIKTLLKNQGSGWLELWKKAHQMLENADVNFDQCYDECRQSIKKRKLNQLIKEIDLKLAAQPDEEERARLSQEKLNLFRLAEAMRRQERPMGKAFNG